MRYLYKFNVLEILSKKPEISQREISKVCNISIGKVNYIITQLSQEGYIEKRKNGKKFRYLITKKGNDYLIKELENFQERKVPMYQNKHKKVTQAIILAAGHRKFFDRSPGLLEIHDTTLLERTVRILEENGINKIVIVTGFEKEKIEKFEVFKGKDHILFTENPRYLWSGSMESLACASGYISDDFVLVEDDILIEEQAIIELLNYEKRDCMLITKESGNGDEAFVEIRNGHIHQISKDIHKLNRIDGEMVGLTKISFNVFQEMLKIYADNRNPYINYEYVLLDVARTVELGYLKLSDIIWAEIDNQEHYFDVVDKVYPLLKVKEEKFRIEELKKLIANALDINENLVTSIETLGGLTNRNYKMIIDGKEYAVRLPGKGTEKFLNRSIEKNASYIASKLGINPKIAYFNEYTGLKIVDYIPNAETLNPGTGKREENIIMVAEIFKRLHNSGENFIERFDVFEKIEEYEQILKNANGKLIEGYSDVKEQVLRLESEYKSKNIKLAPCHIDPLTENFVKSGENRMYLVDWEYAGMNDPLWDVAAYIIETELSPAEEKLLLLEYFNGEISEENYNILLMNKIFQDFLWTIWALMKEANGQDLGAYAIKRFTRARYYIDEYILIKKGEKSFITN